MIAIAADCVHAVRWFVEAMYCKKECRGFDSRLDNSGFLFSNSPNPFSSTMPLSTQPPIEISTVILLLEKSVDFYA
jgi:hypothetical protein